MKLKDIQLNKCIESCKIYGIVCKRNLFNLFIIEHTRIILASFLVLSVNKIRIQSANKIINRKDAQVIEDNHR